MTGKAIVDTSAWTIVINEKTHNKLSLLDSGIGEATLNEVTVTTKQPTVTRDSAFVVYFLILENDMATSD